jgi:type II secretory pathway component PulM
MEATLTSLAQQVGSVTIRSRHLLIAVGTLGGVAVLLAALVGWQVWHPPEQRSARVLGSLDAVLAQSWGSLPQGVQEQLSGAYDVVGLRRPGTRQPARQ